MKPGEQKIELMGGLAVALPSFFQVDSVLDLAGSPMIQRRKIRDSDKEKRKIKDTLPFGP